MTGFKTLKRGGNPVDDDRNAGVAQALSRNRVRIILPSGWRRT